MNKKNILRVPVSPAFLISSITMLLIELTITLSCIIYHICNPDPSFWFAYIVIGVWILITLGAAFVAYRGNLVVKIDPCGIKNIFLKKNYCHLYYNEIQYACFSKSANYGSDASAFYLTVSKAAVKRKNIALTFNPKKEIVIRIDSKNYLLVKEALKTLSLDPFNCHDYKSFSETILHLHDHKIYLVRQSDKTWEYDKID